MPRNRRDCDAIRGTDYLSPGERTWFFDNCITPPAAPRAAAPPADEPTPEPPAAPPAEEPPPPPADEPPLPAAPPADEPPPSARLPVADDLFYEPDAIWSADFDPYTYVIGVPIMNLAVDWYACDLTVWVWTELRKTESVFVGDLAPQEYTEAHIWVPLTEWQVRLLMDVSPFDYRSALPWYQVELTWDWCQR